MSKVSYDTKMVDLQENSYGEAILTLKRGNETKQIVIAETGLSSAAYEFVVDYYLHDLNWTQEKLDNYWDNGGEEKEIDNFVNLIIDQYDDDLTWEELQSN